MSSPISEKIVKLTLQYSAFKDGATKATGVLKNLSSKLLELKNSDVSNAAKGISSIADASGTAGNSINELGEVVQQTGGKFSALKTMATGALLTIGGDLAQRAIGWVKSFTLDPITQGFKEYELKMKSVTTIMTNTGASIEAVNATLDDLNTYSDKTIYSFSDMTDAMGAMGASGLSLEQSATSIKGFFNAAAGVGVDSARATGLLNTALNQSISLGYLNYENWKQLSQAGFGTKFKNTLIETGQEMGRNIDTSMDFNSSLKSGWADTEVLTAALQKMANDPALLDAATKARTFSQVLETAQEGVVSGWARTWEILIGNYNEATELWTGVSEAISEVINVTSDMRNNFAQGFVDAGGVQAILNTIGNIYRFIRNIVVAINDAWKSVGILGTGFGKLPGLLATPFKMLEAITRWIADFKLIPMIIGTAFKVLFTVISPVVWLLVKTGELAVGAWNLVAKGVGVVVGWFDKLKAGVQSLPWKESLITPIQKFVELVKSVTLTPIVEALKTAGSFAKALWTTLTTLSIQPLMDWGRQVRDGFIKGLSDLKNIKFGDFVKSIQDGFKAIFDSVNQKVDLSWLTTAISKPLEAIKNIRIDFSWLTDLQIFKDVSTWVGLLGDRFAELRDSAVSLYDSGLTKLIQFKDNFTIQPVIDSVMNFIEVCDDLYRSIDWSPLITQFNNVRSAVETVVSGMVNFSREVIALPVFTFLQNGIQSVINWLGELDRESIGNGITTALQAMGTAGDWLAEKVRNVWSIVQEGLGNIGDLILQGVQYTVDGLVMLWKGLAAGADGVREVFGNIKDFISEAMGNIKEVLGGALSTENLIKGGIVGYLLILLNGIRKFQKSGTGLLDSISGMFNVFGSISDVLEKVGEALSNFGKSFSPANLLKIGAAIGILALSLKLLSTIPGSEVAKTLGMLAGSITALMVPLVYLDKFGSNAAGMVKNITALIGIATAVTILALAVKIFASMDTGELVKGGLAVVACVTAITLAGKILTTNSSNVTIAVSGMIAMATAVVILAGAVKLFASIPTGDLIKGGAATATALFALAGAMKLMGSVKVSVGTALAVVTMANSVKILAQAVKTFGEMDTGTLVQGMIAVVAALGIITMSLKSLQNMKLAGPAAALLVVSGALTALAIPIGILGSMSLATLAKGLTTVSVALGVITTALKVLSTGGVGALAGAAGIAAVAVALNLLVVPITVFGTLSLATIAQGLIVMAGALGLIVGIALLATAAAPALLALAAAMAAIGVGTAAIALVITAVIQLLEYLTSSTKETFQILLDNVSEFMTMIMEKLPEFKDFALALLQTLLDFLVEAVPRVAEAGFTMIISFLDKVNEYLPQVIQKGSEVVVNFLNGLAEALPQMIDAAMNFILSFIQGMTDALQTYGPQIVDAIVTFILTLIGLVFSYVGQMLSAAGSFIGGFITGAKNKAATIWGNISSYFSTLGSKVRGAIGSIRDKATTFIQGFITGARSKASQIWGNIRGFFSSIPGKVRGAMGNLYNSGASLISGFIQGISDKIEGAKRKVSSAIQGIRNLFPFSPAKEGPFSGKGWVLYSGRSIMDAFGDGIQDRALTAADKAKSAMSRVKDIITDGIQEINNQQINPLEFAATASVGQVKVDSVKMEEVSKAVARFNNPKLEGTGNEENNNDNSTHEEHNYEINLTITGDTDPKDIRKLTKAVDAEMKRVMEVKRKNKGEEVSF